MTISKKIQEIRFSMLFPKQKWIGMAPIKFPISSISHNPLWKVQNWRSLYKLYIINVVLNSDLGYSNRKWCKTQDVVYCIAFGLIYSRVKVKEAKKSLCHYNQSHCIHHQFLFRYSHLLEWRFTFMTIYFKYIRYFLQMVISCQV